METADPESPLKPCGYFGKIGGPALAGHSMVLLTLWNSELTSSAVSAITLGRLRMTFDECLTYVRSRLSNKSSDNTLSVREHCAAGTCEKSLVRSSPTSIANCDGT
jgi:hypothetical protein